MNNKTNKPKIFVILGPTAIGKSSLAFELARKYDASIINADSLQVYKYLDIGTSKPTIEERNIVPHYMVDILEPDQDFNAAIFKKMTGPLIDKLSKENKKIILVGGTFLYVKILLSGMIEENSLRPGIRNKIENIKITKGLPYIYKILNKVDKRSAEKIKPNDFIRIQRALEVYFSSGVKISDLQRKHNFKNKSYEVYKLGIKMERESLNERINKRVDEMIKNGFIDEVKKLRKMGLSDDLKPMKSIGYKELNSYMKGCIEKETAINLIKQNTRKYAKRQSTWLRKEENVNWFSKEKDLIQIEKVFKEFYNC